MIYLSVFVAVRVNRVFGFETECLIYNGNNALTHEECNFGSTFE
jgi:hypothetical protein